MVPLKKRWCRVKDKIDTTEKLGEASSFSWSTTDQANDKPAEGGK